MRQTVEDDEYEEDGIILRNRWETRSHVSKRKRGKASEKDWAMEGFKFTTHSFHNSHLT